MARMPCRAAGRSLQCSNRSTRLAFHHGNRCRRRPGGTFFNCYRMHRMPAVVIVPRLGRPGRSAQRRHRHTPARPHPPEKP